MTPPRSSTTPAEPKAETPAPEPEPPAKVEPEPRAANVIEALQRVQRDMPAVGKSERSEQGYNYRGIEAITSHAQALFGRHGIVFVPEVLELTEVPLTINGKPWTEQRMKVLYRVFGPGGMEDVLVVGPLHAQGRDNSDKGVNKCMTQAFKYALLQTLCVGDKKDDVDAGPANEADATTSSGAPNPETTTASREAIAELRQVVRELRERGVDDVMVTEPDGSVIVLGVTVLRKDEDTNGLRRSITEATAEDLTETLRDRLSSTPVPAPVSEPEPAGAPEAEHEGPEAGDASIDPPTSTDAPVEEAIAPEPVVTGAGDKPLLPCPQCGAGIGDDNLLATWPDPTYVGEGKAPMLAGCASCAPM